MNKHKVFFVFEKFRELYLLFKMSIMKKVINFLIKAGVVTIFHSTSIIKISFFFFLLFAINFGLQAQQSNEELAKAAQNPLANMISFPFQNNTNFGYGPDNDRIQNVLNIQPVIPFFEGKLITRTIFPLLTQPDFTAESGSKTGLADINFTAFYAPKMKGITLGVGPILTIPTGYEYSSGKWGIGPSLVILVMKTKIVYGFVANNVWSFAGDENRSDINQMLFQPFFNYNFKGGKYLSFSPVITANWEAESGQQWLVPLGLAAGKLVRVGGKLPVNFQAGGYYNVVRPDFGPEWQLRVQVQILLPTSIL